MERNEVIQFRVSKPEKEAYNKKAKSLGTTVSEKIRELLDAWVKK